MSDADRTYTPAGAHWTSRCTGDGRCLDKDIDTVARAAVLTKDPENVCPHGCRLTPCLNAGVCDIAVPAYVLTDGLCGWCCLMSSIDDAVIHVSPPEECGVCLETRDAFMVVPVASACMHRLCVDCYRKVFCPKTYGPVPYCPYTPPAKRAPRCPFCRSAQL
jgi:hypothetical protein